jgi:hypothetical protein
VTAPRRDSIRPAEAVAGLMAAGALFLGVFELFYRPFRLAPAALILILIATIMSREQQRLIALALTVVGVCFVIGTTLQVITNHPLY